MSTARRVGRSAVIYGLQPMLARVVSVVMLPVYTRVLTPADYGVLQLLETTVDVAGLLFTAGAINGVNLFYFKRQDEDSRKALLSTAFLVQLGLALLAALFVASLSLPIHRWVLKGDGTPLQVALAAANLATSVLMAVPLLRLQLLERAASYSGLALAKLAIQLSLNILFVAVFRFGVTGVLVSTLVSNVVIGGGLAIAMLRETGVRIDPSIREDLARFGRPVRLTALGSYVMNFGDRWFLAAAWSTAVVGTYGLAYQFGFGFFQFFSAPIIKAWDPIRYQLANRPPEERNPVFMRFFELSSHFFVTSFVAVAVAARPIVLLLTTPAFYSAAVLVTPIVAAYVVQSWTQTFSFQISIAERNALFTRATWLTAAVMMALYAVLIPMHGAAGAAWATFVGFSFRALLAYRYAQQVWPIPYQWSGTFRLCLVATLAVTAIRWMPGEHFWVAVRSSALIFSAYLVVMWFAAVATGDRRRIVRAVRERSGLSELIG